MVLCRIGLKTTLFSSKSLKLGSLFSRPFIISFFCLIFFDFISPAWVIGTFLVVGIIFIPIGIVIQTASNNIFEMEQDYQDEASLTTLNFDIAQDVELPIFLYYKLTNFYQNHRRYVKSRSDAQLQGDEAADLSACAPLDVSPTDPDLNLYPCGLIANSYFNGLWRKTRILVIIFLFRYLCC